MNNTHEWTNFYNELAQKLLTYKNNRSELISVIENIYKNKNLLLSFPVLEFSDKTFDIDPFTVFGLFNRNLSLENRLKLLEGFKEELDLSSSLPDNFDGIPVLDSRNMTFYAEDSKDTIEDLWNLFENALIISKEDKDIENFSTYFDKALNIYGNNTGKVTDGLYWIAPNYFINLDKTNLEFIHQLKNIPKEIMELVPSVGERILAEQYLNLLQGLTNYIKNSSEFEGFVDLSHKAWLHRLIPNSEKNEDHKKETDNNIQYWTYSPGRGAKYWEEFFKDGIIAVGWDSLGDFSSYDSISSITKALQKENDNDKNFKNDSRAVWEFRNALKPGDIVYAKSGRDKIIGRGIVESDYIYDDSRERYKNIRKINWTHKGLWPSEFLLAIKTLNNITNKPDIFHSIESTLSNSNNSDPSDTYNINDFLYNMNDFLNEVYMDKEHYNYLSRLIKRKKNIILEGPPGVGKTFTAKRLAYALMHQIDEDRIKTIQFHQGYAYEDFIIGYRPTQSGFELKEGVFLQFCKLAEEDLDNDYFFIIDEINRGNLNKIFGELFMLIEADKRGQEVNIPYSNETFSIPPNVYIIGTMNTADRSLALLDYALRRRFSYFPIEPGFNSSGFKLYQKELNSSKFDKLIAAIDELNNEITDDPTLGESFKIGHSYFCNLQKDDLEEELYSIIEFDLIPLLKEYWFEEIEKFDMWSENLRKVLEDDSN